MYQKLLESHLLTEARPFFELLFQADLFSKSEQAMRFDANV